MDSVDGASYACLGDMPENVNYATFIYYLYKRGECTNVVFKLKTSDGVKEFPANKMILSMWSPYFADKFYLNNKLIEPGITTVTLNDISAEEFESMLKYMNGYIPEFKSFNKTCDLFKMAKKFNVVGLMKSCREIFSGTIEILPSNVFDILDAASVMEDQSLNSRCLRVLQENTEEVLGAYDLSNISETMLDTLLDLPSLCLQSEFDLLAWVFAWGKNRYLDDSKYSSVRDALEKFLPKLNFLSLTDKEFALLYKHQEKSFTQEEALLIFTNIAIPGLKPVPSWYNSQRSARMYTKSGASSAEQ